MALGTKLYNYTVENPHKEYLPEKNPTSPTHPMRSSFLRRRTRSGKDDGNIPSLLSKHIRSKTGHGAYIKPKHLYFSNETKSLQVAAFIPSNLPVFNVHETLPKNVLRDHFDEVELPDIDLYNYNDVTLAKYLPENSNILHQHNAFKKPKIFEFNDIQEQMRNLPS